MGEGGRLEGKGRRGIVYVIIVYVIIVYVVIVYVIIVYVIIVYVIIGYVIIVYVIIVYVIICAATLCVIIVYFSPGHRLHYICAIIYSDSGQAIDVPITHLQVFRVFVRRCLGSSLFRA